jgi:hypothetical protein
VAKGKARENQVATVGWKESRGTSHHIRAPWQVSTYIQQRKHLTTLSYPLENSAVFTRTERFHVYVEKLSRALSQTLFIAWV